MNPYLVLICVVLGLAGCTSPSSLQGRLGNLEYALVEVRDRQDRFAEEFRGRLESMESSLLQQERFLQEFGEMSASKGSESHVGSMRAKEATDAAIVADPPAKPVSQPSPSPDQKPARPEEAQIAYDQALAKYRSGEYVRSRADFLAFQQRFPDHPLVPNALYWQAETHYAQKQFAQSILVFKELSRRFPGSAKSPDALLKAGFAYEQLGDMPNARFHLQIVIDDHANTPAARLARDRLAQLPE